MVLFLTEQDVDQILTMAMAVDAVEEAFVHLGSGKAENVPRRRLHAPEGMLHLMAASLPELGFMGFKAYTTYPNRVRFKVWLYSTRTGDLLAIMDADRLGQMRTGAASGVATRHMARAESKTVGVLGSGWQAQTQLEAVCHVRRPAEVLVFSRSAERRQAFCSEMQDRLKIPCHPANGPDDVVEAADILITITSSVGPVLNSDKLRPGTHINAAGSNSVLKRELDEVCVKRCASVVVDSKEQAKLECGELLVPIEKGIIRWDGIRELSDVVTGRVVSRKDPNDITLFKSLGLALEDVAVAGRIYRVATERQIGQRLNI